MIHWTVIAGIAAVSYTAFAFLILSLCASAKQADEAMAEILERETDNADNS